MIIEDLEQNTPAWLEWRKSGIGCSEVAAICGVNPFCTALEVYNEKVGLTKKKKNAAMQRGQDFEKEALSVFEMQMGVKDHYKPVCAVHDERNYLKASIDGYCKKTNTLVELKVPNRIVMDMAKAGSLPLYYMYQVQAELMITKAEKAYFACYSPDTFEIYVVVVEPDAFIKWNILSHTENFYTCHLIPRVPPEKERSKK